MGLTLKYIFKYINI